MNNFGRTAKRLLAMILLILLLIPAMPAALAEGYSAAVTPEKLAVYSDKGMTRKLATLKRYTIVTVEEISGSVAEITYQGYTLYTKAASLKAVEDFATLCSVNQDTRVYLQPDTESKSLSLPEDTQVYLLATSGNWAMIEMNANVGYTYAGHLTPADTIVEPEEPETTPVPEDEYGDVTICDIDAVVTASSLKVYKKASVASEKLGTISFGQKVTVHAYNAEWAYISVSDKYGFCALSGLAKASVGNTPAPDPTPAPEDPSLEDAIPGTVTDDIVIVYASASTSARKLGTLKKGAEVNVVEYNSTWAYIELNGNYGYCLIAALTPTSQVKPDEDEDEDKIIGDATTVIGTATVIMPGAPIYAKANTDSKSSTLSIGQNLDLYAYNSEWAYVALDGNKGYVQTKNINYKSYTELTSGDSGSAVRDLEEKLLVLGYLDTVPAATYGTNTSAAVRRLQAACGLEQTGTADQTTLRIAFSGNAPVSPMLNATLQLGDVNSNVSRMQTRLYALSYLSKATSMDGEFGNNTVSAVKLFQSAAGLAVTGVADSATLQALYAKNAPSLPSGQKAPDASTGSLHGSSYLGDMPAGTASFTTEYSDTMTNIEKLEYVIYIAQNQLGKPYVYGTAGPSTFDCSGFTSYCFKKINVKLNRSAYAQGYDDDYTKVSAVEDLKRGDQVYFNTIADSDLSDHVGIYLGNNYFIHASSGGAKIVVSDLSTGYYKRVYSWGHHILET